MDYKLPQAHQSGHNLSAAAASASAAAAAHHPQPYIGPSYSYLSNPNPDPYPTVGHDNSAPSADLRVLRPPGVDPYAAHDGGYEGYLTGSYPYIQAPVAAGGVGLTSYYYGPGGGEAHTSYGAIWKAVSTKKTFEDLETKKQKLIQGGAAADSVRVCTVCNVVCNSDTVFASHLSGEKHAMKALGRSSSGLASIPVKPVNWTNKVAQMAFKSAISKGLKMAPKVVKSVYCEVCKIDCNSQEVLNSHKLGKKHMRNLQKLQESITPKPMNAPVMTAGKENVVTDKDKVVDAQIKRKVVPASKQDLETKKRKVLEGGATAAAVRVCSLCNVVCNSQKVFDLHVAGQKHLAMVKKQQEATFS
ncbi:zinc finger protein 346-like [Phoenix dactylifera]|uniref:Zinc finger protein 346-like n=1 Tax=Phoenix dactylifera TaxID=42345 RepID=A0A8B7BHM0_PHODC|nr:zinc finger protein 346-like [Phoenix dactylifera]